MQISLIDKYNTPVPRYTSYPTVPHWQTEIPSSEDWISSLRSNYELSPAISLYIHLPFCEALCTYCGCNKRITKNHAVETPYIDAVLKEWDIYTKSLGFIPRIKEIHLGGGTPTFFAPSELERLITGIVKGAEITSTHSFSFEAHPNSTTQEHIDVLYNLGFNRLSIGVQDVTPSILEAINRQQTVEEVIQVTEWARNAGYQSINYDIIYGLPFQREINIFDTAQFIGKQRPDRIAFYSYAHVPWKSKGQRAFTLEDVPQGGDKSKLYSLGRYLLEMEGYKTVGMDHFCLESDSLYKAYRGGEMHRNFMGYTSDYTRCSIALGASSIGDSWSMYVQNEKGIEAYQEKVNTGNLPLIKGHQLSSAEERMRAHILNLMCRDTTRFAEDEMDNLLFPPKNQTKHLIRDGLLKVNGRTLKVTESGKYFIRNICAAIDPIFQNQTNTNPVFSKAI